MPLYDFKCGKGHLFERAVPLALFHEPQHCECGLSASRQISAPRLMGNDEIAPCWGPDGRQHTSLASYRKSLKAENNPRGENFIELGNDKITPKEYKFDERGARDDIRGALADIKAGKPVPAPVALED